MPLLEADNIVKSYDDYAILKENQIKLPQGKEYVSDYIYYLFE